MRFLRVREVCGLIGVSKPTLYKWIKRGEFPGQVSISHNRVGFLETEVMAFMEAKIADRDRGAEARRERALRAVGK
ncbi:MAG: AlpA family phage regulatory protein [Amaricoccus sp.]